MKRKLLSVLLSLALVLSLLPVGTVMAHAAAISDNVPGTVTLQTVGSDHYILTYTGGASNSEYFFCAVPTGKTPANVGEDFLYLDQETSDASGTVVFGSVNGDDGGFALSENVAADLYLSGSDTGGYQLVGNIAASQPQEVVIPTLAAEPVIYDGGQYAHITWDAGVGVENMVIIRIDSAGNYAYISNYVNPTETSEWFDWTVELGETYSYFLNCEVDGAWNNLSNTVENVSFVAEPTLVIPTLVAEAVVYAGGQYTHLTWNAGVGTTRGVIVRFDSNGGYAQISGYIDLTAAGEYYDWDVEAGVTYTYGINCEVSGELGTVSNWYAVEFPAATLVIPTLVAEAVVYAGGQYTHLTWNAGVGTTRGVIVRFDSNGGFAQISGYIDLTAAGEYYDWDVEAGVTYTYGINCEVDGELGTVSNWYAVQF